MWYLILRILIPKKAVDKLDKYRDKNLSKRVTLLEEILSKEKEKLKKNFPF